MTTPTSTKKKREAQSAPALPIQSREKAKNTPPANVWQTLRRLLNCNKAQLATRLGISTRTLRDWERATEEGGSAGARANERAADLMQSVLRAAESDTHAQWRINWDAIHTIGGKR